MPNLVTELITRELEQSFDESEGAVLVSYAGLTVKEDSALRDDLAAHGVEFRMVRNTLCKRVMSERGFEMPEDFFTGNTAIAWGDQEATIGAAKVFTAKEVKKAGKVGVKAGIFEGRLLGVDETKALADIPDKDTLRAQLVSVLSGSARGLVQILAGVPGGLARVMQANIDQNGGLEEAPETEAPAIEEEPAEESAEEAPAEEDTPEAKAPAEEDSPEEEAPAEGDTPAEEAPAEEAPAEGDTPEEEAAAEEETPKEEAPTEEE